jgi:hypothetical protein
MTTSDREDSQQSRNRTADPIGPFQSKRRAQTFDTGFEPKKTLQGIARTKVIQNQKINTYKYEAIAYHDEIRILKILHGQKDDPLQCMLFSSALSSSVRPSQSKLKAHSYWALSYWWGEDAPTHPIEMFDDTGVRKGLQKMSPFNSSGIFYVRNNLAAALRQFRGQTEDINVWVDALCINQGDLTEKNAQVARMHEIYSEAGYVCVWLGAGKPETHATFEFLKSILDLQYFDKIVKTGEDPKRWMLIVNLMKNRWFSRRWVIQELALARKATVLWGDETISWQDFADAIALFMTKHDDIKEMLEKLKRSFEVMSDPDAYIGGLEPRALGANTLVHATSTLFRKSDDGRIQQRLLNLEVLVSSLFLAFEASEPRDTVYAVLSLAKDASVRVDLADPPSWIIHPKHNMIIQILNGVLYFCLLLLRLVKWLWDENDDNDDDSPMPQPDEYSVCIDDRITPDYDKRLTDVCADFMEYCIETSESLDILCRHWAPRPKKLSPLEKLRIEKIGGKENEEMPSWIPSIEGHAYGGPLGRLRGRSNGDSFVGGHPRYNKQYNASGGLSPCVQFGKYYPNKLQKDGKLDEQRPAPNRTSPIGLESVPEVAARVEEQSQPRIKKFDGTLQVKGFKIDSIERLSGRALDGVIPSLALEWGGWPKSDDGPPPVEVPDKLWRTLVADRDPDGNNAPPWYRRACLECLQHVNPSGDLNTEQFKNVECTPASMKMFMERVKAVVWRRQFFVTKGKEGRKKPLYGLAPPDTRERDVICILFGCSVPVVLRKQPSLDGIDRYTFVGECYVHGMMDGEALPAKKLAYPYSNVKYSIIV